MAGRYFAKLIRLPAIVLIATIVLVVAFFDRDLGIDWHDYDKWLHGAAFAAIALLASLVFPRIAAWRLLLPLIGLSALTELAQFMPRLSREPSWLDFAANVAAIAVTLLLVALIRHGSSR